MDGDRDRPHAAAADRRRVGRIVVRGEFGPLLGAALPECEIAVLSCETHLTARVRDEAELFGLLERLLGQAKTRVPELVPIRHGRMLVSPFTFYRVRSW